MPLALFTCSLRGRYVSILPASCILEFLAVSGFPLSSLIRVLLAAWVAVYIFSLVSPFRLAAAPPLRLKTTKCRWLGQRPFQRSAPSNLASAFLLLTLAVRDQRLPATLGIASSNVIPPATRGRQCRKDATRTGSEAWHVASSKKGKRYHWAQETGVGNPTAGAPRGRQRGDEDPHRTCHQRPAVRGRSA